MLLCPGPGVTRVVTTPSPPASAAMAPPRPAAQCAGTTTDPGQPGFVDNLVSSDWSRECVFIGGAMVT